MKNNLLAKTAPLRFEELEEEEEESKGGQNIPLGSSPLNSIVQMNTTNRANL